MGAFLGIIGLIGIVVSIIVLIVKAIKKRPKKKTLIALAVCLGCFIAGLSITPSSPSVDDHDAEQIMAEQPMVKEQAEIAKKPPTKDEIAELVAMASYKDLLRTPDDYVDQYVVATVKISQILDGGWLDDNVYYFGYTDNDGYELYFDDEYCFLDKRVDDTTKLLEDDILKVYGKFTGLQTFKRALTKVDAELPRVEMLYVEIIE